MARHMYQVYFVFLLSPLRIKIPCHLMIRNADMTSPMYLCQVQYQCFLLCLLLSYVKS